MRLLITGGTGFVGRRLVERALAAGHDVMVISRDPERARRQLPQSVRIGDDAMDFASSLPEAIVNLAGEPIADRRWSDPQKTRLVESRRHATRDVVALCEELARRDQPPEVLVSGSAMGYYGDQGGGEDAPPVTEQTPPHDEFAHRLCKRWEQAAAGVKDFGVRLAILRTGLVLDEGGGMLKKLVSFFFIFVIFLLAFAVFNYVGTHESGTFSGTKRRPKVVV